MQLCLECPASPWTSPASVSLNQTRRRLTMALTFSWLCSCCQMEWWHHHIMPIHMEHQGQAFTDGGGGTMSRTQILKITDRLHKGQKRWSVRATTVRGCHRYRIPKHQTQEMGANVTQRWRTIIVFSLHEEENARYCSLESQTQF